MNKLIDALSTSDTFTANGALAHSTCGSEVVDFFFKVGAARNLKADDVWDTFCAAFESNPTLAFRALFWARDVRGGAGERRIFRELFSRALKDPKMKDRALRNLKNVPFYGRWDDLWEVIGLDEIADLVIASIVKDELTTNGLLAKWLPRQGKVAAFFRERLGFGRDHGAYRRAVVKLSKTVEQQMSARDWDKIEYSHVPSCAMKLYSGAFKKNDPTRFSAFKEALKSGVAKINASAIFPHDVLRGTDSDIIQAQWDALPDYMSASEHKNVLPVIDVSGSMKETIKGTSVRMVDVAIALGLYMAERNRGSFKDFIATFSAQPSWFRMRGVRGVLRRKHIMESDSNWGMNTNLLALFTLLLKQAVDQLVPQEDMPEIVLIVSDMQFDSACGRAPYGEFEHMFRQAGYRVPQIVFWNLNSPAGQGTHPVKVRDDGTALVSGFSPSILKSILSCNNMTPESIVKNTLSSDRYSRVSV